MRFELILITCLILLAGCDCGSDRRNSRPSAPTTQAKPEDENKQRLEVGAPINYKVCNIVQIRKDGATYRYSRDAYNNYIIEMKNGVITEIIIEYYYKPKN